MRDNEHLNDLEKEGLVKYTCSVLKSFASPTMCTFICLFNADFNVADVI